MLQPLRHRSVRHRAPRRIADPAMDRAATSPNYERDWLGRRSRHRRWSRGRLPRPFVFVGATSFMFDPSHRTNGHPLFRPVELRSEGLPFANSLTTATGALASLACPAARPSIACHIKPTPASRCWSLQRLELIRKPRAGTHASRWSGTSLGLKRQGARTTAARLLGPQSPGLFQVLSATVLFRHEPRPGSFIGK